MISIELSLLLAAGGMLAGGAIAWGVLRTTVSQLKELVVELRAEVKTLREDVGKLRTSIAVLQAADDRDSRVAPTSRHRSLARE